MSTFWQLHKMEELRPHMLLHIRLGQQVLPCYRTWVQISVYAAAWFQMTEAITLNGSLLEQMPILVFPFTSFFYMIIHVVLVYIYTESE